jgi:hypothetical protein
MFLKDDNEFTTDAKLKTLILLTVWQNIPSQFKSEPAQEKIKYCLASNLSIVHTRASCFSFRNFKQNHVTKIIFLAKPHPKFKCSKVPTTQESLFNFLLHAALYQNQNPRGLSSMIASNTVLPLQRYKGKIEITWRVRLPPRFIVPDPCLFVCNQSMAVEVSL